MGLLSDSVRKLQTELQNAVEEIVKRHCRFETQIKSALKQNSHTQSTNYMQVGHEDLSFKRCYMTFMLFCISLRKAHM